MAPQENPAKEADSLPNDPSPTLRLRGESEGMALSFALEGTEMGVGSARANGIRIQGRGVSRHHAVLRRRGERWLLEDLESKNGTFVNGQRVSRTELHVDDRLQIGDVELVLESTDPDDEALGLEIDLPSGLDFASQGLLTRPDTSILGLGRKRTAPELVAFVIGFTDRLSPPNPDPMSALALVGETLGVRAAAWLEWPGGHGATSRAQWGEPGPLPTGDELRGLALEPGDCATWRGAGEAWGAVAGQPGGDVAALLLWGDDGALEFGPLPELLLRLLLGFDRDGLELGDHEPAGAAPTAGPLVFPPGIVEGRSRSMRGLYQQMAPLVQGDVPVLVSGETGVGKEHLARTLHLSSPRADGPFVALNCAAIPDELLEAELFGIGRGVATGVKERPGKFAQAEGGTLFLDEIGDMPPTLQAKLLRALQEKEIHPLGEAPRRIDARVISATNTDLAERMADGRFREDLYYRIAGYALKVPPLRDRREDLPSLVSHFTRRASQESGKAIRGFTVKALRVLSQYPWPGNVRQLEHEIRRLVYRCRTGQAVDSSMIAEDITGAEPAPGDPQLGDSLHIEAHVTSLERRLIRRALRRTQGNRSQAAKLLGLSRNGLANRMRRLELDIFETPSDSG
ncbi:MAG: sigma 54-interacting transcriptional regulator [Acidobacteriota bacterium]